MVVALFFGFTAQAGDWQTAPAEPRQAPMRFSALVGGIVPIFQVIFQRGKLIYKR